MTTNGGEQPSTGPTLFLESERLDPAEAFCAEILGDADEEEYRVVQLTSTRSFDSLSDAFDVQLEEIDDPSEVAVIIMSPQSEDESTVTEVSDDVPLYGFWVDPQDLTGISVAFSRLLDRWEDEPGETKICLRNIESLLPYHDTDLIYRFLNTVLATLQGAGAEVHAHFRPSVTDDRTLDLLSSLFASVVEPTESSRVDPASEDEQSPPSEPEPSETPPSEPEPSETTDRGRVEKQGAAATMSVEEIEAFLDSTGHGVLAFAGSPPYAIPMSYGYDLDTQQVYFQFAAFEGSEKQSRLANSSRLSLVVSRYTRPDRWRSVVVDGSVRPLSETSIDEATVLEAYAKSDLASVEVFVEELSNVSFEWYVLDPTSMSGRQSASDW